MSGYPPDKARPIYESVKAGASPESIEQQYGIPIFKVLSTLDSLSTYHDEFDPLIIAEYKTKYRLQLREIKLGMEKRREEKQKGYKQNHYLKNRDAWKRQAMMLKEALGKIGGKPRFYKQLAMEIEAETEPETRNGFNYQRFRRITAGTIKLQKEDFMIILGHLKKKGMDVTPLSEMLEQADF